MSNTFDKTKPVQTVQGRPAHIIEVPGGYKGPSGETMLAVVRTDIGDQARGFFETGQFFKDQQSEWDLVNVELPPKQHTVRLYGHAFRDGSQFFSVVGPLEDAPRIIARCEIDVVWTETRPLPESELEKLRQPLLHTP